MSVVEVIATVFGLACVWLCVRQSVWNWPTGLVQVVLYAWVFYGARLYSDFLLQLVYVVLQVYGWWHWVRAGDGPREELPVTRVRGVGLGVWVGVGVMGAGVLGYLMQRYTDAAYPYWDALITSLSLVAQYLLARKVLENWGFWIVVDVLAIGVYLAKGLYVTTGLYAVFLGMAVAGLLAWRKSLAVWCLESSSLRTGDTSSSSTSDAATVMS